MKTSIVISSLLFFALAAQTSLADSFTGGGTPPPCRAPTTQFAYACELHNGGDISFRFSTSCSSTTKDGVVVVRGERFDNLSSYQASGSIIRFIGEQRTLNTPGDRYPRVLFAPSEFLAEKLGFRGSDSSRLFPSFGSVRIFPGPLEAFRNCRRTR